MRNILIVAFFFPPEGGPGAQRPAKFCKYLPEFGWKPSVISRYRQGERTGWADDSSLREELPDTLTIVRSKPSPTVPYWAQAAPQIDIGRRWLGPIWEAIQGLHAENPQDAVLITMSPFDLASLAPRIRRELGLPVIFDLRDPWALDGWRRRNRLAAARDKAAMLKALPSANCIVANTPEARKALLAAVPSLEPSRIAVIPNGYDAADFAAPLPRHDANHDLLEIVHIGTLHTSAALRERGLQGLIRRILHHRPEPLDPSGRSPLHLMRAMKKIEKENPALGRRLRLTLIGREDPAIPKLIADLGLAEEQVRIEGYKRHDQVISRMRAADVLFLPLHGLPPDRRSLLIPGKIYEYLASGRPILGCLPAGDARDLVAAAPLGYVANPTDPVDIASVILQIEEDRRAGRHARSQPPDWIDAYERRNLTRKLATLLDGL